MNFSSRKPQEPIIYPIEIILASQSVGRRMLLEKLGLRFRVIATHVDESTITDLDAVNMLRRRAVAKADEIVKNPRVYGLSEEAQSLVIAADSMAVIGGKTYGKPGNRDDAKRMLAVLMGRTHTFVTATSIALVDRGKEKKRWEKVIKTKVMLRKLKQPQLEAYVNRYDLTRFAASYAFNEAPWDIVTKIDGSYTNVIGLPFEFLLPILRTLKIIT